MMTIEEVLKYLNADRVADMTPEDARLFASA